MRTGGCAWKNTLRGLPGNIPTLQVKSGTHSAEQHSAIITAVAARLRKPGAGDRGVSEEVALAGVQVATATASAAIRGEQTT